MDASEAKYWADVRIIEGGSTGLGNRPKMKSDDLESALAMGVSEESFNRYFKENPSKEVVEKVKHKPEIVLPYAGKTISEFVQEVLEVIKPTEELFYQESTKNIVQIKEVIDKNTGTKKAEIHSIQPSEFITKIEQYITPCIYGEKGRLYEKSVTRELANTTLQSAILKDGLPKISRIFNTPIPVKHMNQLTFPKRGYDERFNSWLPYDAPEISKPNMSLEEAKQIILEIYKEFAFKENQDYVNAIAAAITPFSRGLMSEFYIRTPMFLYMANRERAGKDYCAGVTGIIYEGYAIDEGPISAGENTNSSDELRKKATSYLILGKTRLHSVNNKGYLNNAFLEALLTATHITDRVLGRNDLVTLPNLLDVSMSGNLGLGMTPDLVNRSVEIHLFLAEEDANLRKFEKPNLHAWVKENRNNILSAFYALVRNWHENGEPEGQVPFASFPEWAKFVGGIMECAGYNSPCKKNQSALSIGGDTETADMKELFEVCYNKYPDMWINKQQIKEVISQNSESGSSAFGYIDFNDRSQATKFGNKLIKFIGRILSDIRLIVKDNSVRASRHEYKFTRNQISQNKLDIFGNLGNLGNQKPISEYQEYNLNKRVLQVANVTEVARLPISEPKDQVLKEIVKDGVTYMTFEESAPKEQYCGLDFLEDNNSFLCGQMWKGTTKVCPNCKAKGEQK